MKKLMIVDDEPDQIKIVKIMLGRTDDEYEVIGADSGAECLKLLEKNEKPDLILLDIMMPEMDGWEVHKRIKEKAEWRNIPIVFLTATDDESSKSRGKNIAEDFIAKPFDINEFKERIDMILKKDRSIKY